MSVLVIPNGHLVANLFMYGAAGLGIGSALWLLHRTGDPVRYRRRSTAYIWFFLRSP